MIIEPRITAFLRRCPYFQEVLTTFRCKLDAVRLMRLAERHSALCTRGCGESVLQGLDVQILLAQGLHGQGAT